MDHPLKTPQGDRRVAQHSSIAGGGGGGRDYEPTLLSWRGHREGRTSSMTWRKGSLLQGSRGHGGKKARSCSTQTLILSLAGGFFWESINFLIWFFAEWYVPPLIHFTIETYFLAGFFHTFHFPECTLKLYIYRDIGGKTSGKPGTLPWGNSRIFL